MTGAKKFRTALIFLAFIAAYSAIVINLCYLQILHQTFFSTLGKQQYNINVTVQPPRALIYDCNEKPIAMNTECLSAFILPTSVTQPDQLSLFLKNYFPAALQRWQNHKNKYFMYVKRRLAPHEIAIIEKHAIEDLHVLKEPCRFYPFQNIGTLIGITDIDNNGLGGIELLFNNQLQGTPTTCTLQRDARSGHFYFNKKLHHHGKEGTPVHLTIDSDLQFFAHEELKQSMDEWQAQEGGVIILDPVSGALLASACLPDFNPNDITTTVQQIAKHRPFTESYEFGSILKPFAAMAALESGVVTPDELVDCENKTETRINGFKITTVHPNGIVPFTDVIVHSNNIGMVKIIARVGEPLYEYFQRLGFTHKTPINFPGQQAGYITPPAQWSRRSIVSLSFGYEIRATAIQLAQAFGLIANGGIPIALHLIKGQAQTKENKPRFSARTIEQMRAMLTKTVEEGTARRARIKGYTILGKTGTAKLLENGRYSESKNIYSFAGIIEKDAYKRVILVYIHSIGVPHYKLHADHAVVPLFERVAEKVLIHDKII